MVFLHQSAMIDSKQVLMDCGRGKVIPKVENVTAENIVTTNVAQNITYLVANPAKLGEKSSVPHDSV